MYLTMILIILWAICVVIWFCVKKLSPAERSFAKIPGFRAYPIVGNSPHFLISVEQIFIKLREMYTKFGSISRLHAVNARAVNIYDPQDIETILSTTRHIDKDIPYTFLKPWLCEGLLTSNGNKWHQRRKMLTGVFHFNILKRYIQTFTQQTDLLLRTAEQEVGKPQTDVLPLIAKASLNIMCETAMGISMESGLNSVSNKYFESIHIFGTNTVKRLCRIWLYADSLFNMSHIGRLQNRILTDLHEFTCKIILRRKEYLNENDIHEFHDDNEIYGKKNRLAMLDLLIHNEREGRINLEGIREEVDTFMFEGHDTTATGLSFMIVRLANEPEIQDKIYNEMKTIFEDSSRSPTMDDLNEMKYLECCIKESLRIYPSVPFIARYLTEPTTLCGYLVPSSTICILHIYDVHHREDLYPEPEKFIPERFLPENSIKRHPYAYIPFSAGPRNCIGQKFAMLELKTVISSLLRRFRLTPVTKVEDMVFKADMILRTNHPMYVNIERREK